MGYKDRKTTLALTMGDVAGIGPEIIAKVLAQKDIVAQSRVLIIGNKDVLNSTFDTIKSKPPKIVSLNDPMEVLELPVGSISLHDPSREKLEFTIGEPNATTGKASIAYLKTASQLVLAGKASAIVTAPISKAAIQKAELYYFGHTDFLAEATNTKKAYMTAHSPELKIISMSAHITLRRAHSEIKQARVIKAIQLLNDFLTATMDNKKPRIVVCGFNPHAGENGLLGHEEITEIKPAVDAMRNMDCDVVGPIAADVALVSALDGRFDGVVAMYHDQCMIPIKLLSRNNSCQITLGMPIIRTSVNHGTAEDIAGKNLADPSSLIAALQMAEKMVALRKQGYEI